MKLIKGLLTLLLVLFLAACTSPADNSGGDPALTGMVSIDGIAQVGQTLTADTFALDGSGSISYRWYRNNDPISNANGSTYTLVEADRGAFIKVEVRRSGYSGSVFSGPKGPVAGIDDPPLTGTVSIDGTAQVGQVFTANTSTLNGSGSMSYQWYRGNTPINGANANTYILVEADRDAHIKVEVSRSGYVGTVFSNSRGPIAGSGEPLVEGKYSREYWGEWIRMDTGDTYYFSNNDLTINGQPGTLPVTPVIERNNQGTSSRVMHVGEGQYRYWLYASRPATATFTGRVADMRDGGQGRAARSISLGGMELLLENIKNEADKQRGKIDDEGEFEVSAGIAEDEYRITFPEAPEIPPIVVSPGYSGDDIGTVNIAEGARFKVTIEAVDSRTADKTRLYANNAPYSFEIKITNTGTEVFEAAEITLLDFGDLVYSPSNYDRFLRSIQSGEERKLVFNISCPPFAEMQPSKDFTINIAITDTTINGKTWNDSVRLQFHKAPVNFNIKCEYGREVRGMIVSPGQKAHPFIANAASDYASTITLPWTAEPYLVVFSGATYTTESVYSLGIDVQPDTDFENLYNRGSVHEPNDTAAEAYSMDIRTEPKIMSYLVGGNIDYFSVSLGNEPPINIVLDSPTNVQAEALSETSVRVSWNQVAGATGYRVYNSDDVLVSDLGGAVSQYEHSDLNPGTTYGYRVRALAGNIESSPSATASARTWERIQYYNKAINAQVVSGIPHYYRFYVVNGNNFTFTANSNVTVKWEDSDANWFTVNSGTSNHTPNSTGWAYFRLSNAGSYSLRISSSEAAVSSFTFPSLSSVITGPGLNETEKTVTFKVPYGTNLSAVTPSVYTSSGWTQVTTGAQNFNAPVDYIFTNGTVSQAYTVAVIADGQGGVVVNPPPSTGDETILGFPVSSFTVSRSGAGGPPSMSITLSGTAYSSIEWWVDEAYKTAEATNNGRTFAVQASAYTIGKHTLTVAVYKDGVPYSNNVDFTVTQ